MPGLCYTTHKEARNLTMRIYLDNCCFNRPYDDQTNITNSLETQAKLAIQEFIKLDKYELCVSAALYHEVDASPYVSQSDIIRDFILDNSSYYIGEEMKDAVEALASKIMEAGIKYYDACHVASAILAGCEYFITVDKRLLKYNSDRIKMRNPVDFISETGVE